jgi:hypothetical protein
MFLKSSSWMGTVKGMRLQLETRIENCPIEPKD